MTSINRKFLLWFWAFVLGSLLAVFLFFFAVSQGWFGKLPAIEELENPKSALASEVISSDGVIIGKYYRQNRSNVRFTEISPDLINALIATEDIRFHQHSGIDLKGLLRAMVFLGKDGGASTISQQLAKNLFHEKVAKTYPARVLQKFKEWIIAVRLEKRYTKEEIITMYLNTVQFTGSAYGIKSAAKTFFAKTPAELNVSESAVLVGLLKGISAYNPVRNPDKALNRRNTVLLQMYKYEFLTEAEFDSIKSKPIVLRYKEEDHNEGLAPHFREHLRVELDKWCAEKGYDLYKDGLKIYVTLNSKMQEYAEEAAQKHIKTLQKEFYNHWKGQKPWGKDTIVIERSMKMCERYNVMKNHGRSESEIKEAFNRPTKMTVFSYSRGLLDTVMTPLDSIKYHKYFLHTGFMALDPHTGHIKAWVGDASFKHFKYDHVNKNSTRQVGSTFKPLVYTLAVDNGKGPCSKMPNIPVTFNLGDGETWTPKNADGKEGGEMTLYKALGLSVNNVTAQLMKELGPDGPRNVIKLAKDLGINGDRLQPYPSICLGTMDLSVFEMVGAFGAFANKGVWMKPTYIVRIEDKNGNILMESSPESNEAINEKTAFVMLKMMERVANYGTAAKLRWMYKFTGTCAGKTGTTQNNSDGWFIGVTPDLVAGGWTGCDDRAVHFRTLELGSGAHMQMPIFAGFMNSVSADKRLGYNFTRPFEAPKEELGIELDCSDVEDNSVNPSDVLGN